ncbi:DUF5615 family PIN-like protein [Candidatus Poriferisodalis sp.]|uniref:DUF5615 family PIN-like protein n=1 Tax=Candidatus Poriferisodalis sp. TaxID=3101277 RepID=UPI003B017389
MRLLLDEMHAPAVAAALVAAGHDVAAVAAEPSMRGRSDASLLQYGTESGRVLVTENVGDFLVLVQRRVAVGGTHPGVILTNPARFNRASLAYPGNLISALATFLADPPVEGDSWTWWLQPA